MTQVWTDEAILDALRVADRRGLTTAPEYQRRSGEYDDLPSLRTVTSRFDGSWARARKLAGLLTEERGRYGNAASKLKAFMDVCACADELGHDPTRTEYDRWSRGHDDRMCGSSAAAKLGPWPAVREKVRAYLRVKRAIEERSQS